MTAQSGRAAGANILERLALLRRDGVTPAVQEPVSITAKNLGHFLIFLPRKTNLSDKFSESTG
jgi:hypothetical protein